jgi:hypothetical protein
MKDFIDMKKYEIEQARGKELLVKNNGDISLSGENIQYSFMFLVKNNKPILYINNIKIDIDRIYKIQSYERQIYQGTPMKEDIDTWIKSLNWNINGD